MIRLDEKLSRIRAGVCTRSDFTIADAKDGDMGGGVPSTGPRKQGVTPTREHGDDNQITEAALEQA